MKRCTAGVLLALGLAGCGGFTATTAPPSAPSTTRTPPPAPATSRSAVAAADRRHEYPTAPQRARVFGGSASPELAVRAFAIGYINWTAATVTGRMRGLAALSVGQARAEVTQAAVATAHDYELRRGGVANSGAVEAVAPLAGGGGRWAVVTLERTTASATGAYRGLAPSWHVAIATVQRASGGWVVSGWQPEG